MLVFGISDIIGQFVDKFFLVISVRNGMIASLAVILILELLVKYEQDLSTLTMLTLYMI